MKNYIQTGKSLDLTAPAGGVLSGQAIKVGAIVGFVSADTVAGDKFVLNTKGVFLCNTDTGTAWAEGDLVYWDDTNKVFTKTSASNTKVGAVVIAKLAADTTSTIYLPGIV